VAIEADTLAIPQHGFFNVHPGDLPRYRGNACPNWAILNGDDHIGLCVHKVVPELDGGPVLLRERFALSPDTYIGEIYDWWLARSPELLCEAVRLFQTGENTLEEQPSDPKTWLRGYPRRPEDSRIDWSQPAEFVHRLVRASSRPFAGAYALLEGETRVTVWRAEVHKHQGDFLAIPGQVLTVEGGHPIVACGENTLRLNEVSVEGCGTDEEGMARIGKSLRNRLT
jgi:methionyl-tRNA formyltransferase